MKSSTRLAVAMTLALGVAAIAAEAPSALTIELWPGAVPGETTSVGDEQAKKKPGPRPSSITNVSKPTVIVSRPDPAKNTGVAVVVFPGGGYSNLAWEHEGTMVADWLNSIGVTAAVVKYRVPRRPGTPKGEPPVAALMDAQRAISLVRANAADWVSTPRRSACSASPPADTSPRGRQPTPTSGLTRPVDAKDQASCRPDFAVLIYPGGITKRGSDELDAEIHVSSQSQPTFLAVATDDTGPAIGTASYYLALKRAGVPAELHAYAAGGHGFGMRKGDRPAASWPARCEDWMREQGILKK